MKHIQSKITPSTYNMVVSTIKRLLKENKKEELRYFKTLVYISIYPNFKTPYDSFRDANDFIMDICGNTNTFHNILSLIEKYNDYELFGHIIKETSKNILGYEYRKIK